MAKYFLKSIDGPRGQEGYPYKDGLVHFAENRQSECERFKKCSGFVLYETWGRGGRNEGGAKTVFAYGTIADDQPLESEVEPLNRDGKLFPYAAKINPPKRVDPKVGIPQREVEGIINKKIRQSRGGIIEIAEKNWFTILCTKLDEIHHNQNLPQ